MIINELDVVNKLIKKIQDDPNYSSAEQKILAEALTEQKKIISKKAPKPIYKHYSGIEMMEIIKKKLLAMDGVEFVAENPDYPGCDKLSINGSYTQVMVSDYTNHHYISIVMGPEFPFVGGKNHVKSFNKAVDECIRFLEHCRDDGPDLSKNYCVEPYQAWWHIEENDGKYTWKRGAQVVEYWEGKLIKETKNGKGV